jgi:cyclohexyl-isocyanide hydratase
MEHLLDQDVVVVPGGRGILDLLKCEAVMQVLKDAHDRVKFVASVCTGSVVLGKAGLLRGRRATTHHLHFDELLEHSPGVVPVRQRVVVDGKIVTGAGISSSLDTGLTLIELIFGQDLAQEVARRIEYASYKGFSCH